MPIILYRVDERLIHGQVVVGWGVSLKIEPTILSVKDAATRISENGFEGEKTLILVDSPLDIWKMLEKGVKINTVNVGGVHFKSGRNKILPYLYLSDEEISVFKKIISSGVRCECQDMPLAEKHDLETLFTKLGL
jgi:mannose/fructose/N-acetylgalactosamine-specific phosphotransferase system component IIB